MQIPSVFTQLQTPAKWADWQQNMVKSSRASGWPSAHPFALFHLIKGCNIRDKQRHFQKEITHWKSCFSGCELPLWQSYKGNKGRGGDVHYQINKGGFKLQLKSWQICDARSELSYWLNGPLEKILMILCSRDGNHKELNGSISSSSELSSTALTILLILVRNKSLREKIIEW